MQAVVPFNIKISYYAFMAILIPTYAINYPLANFFNLCDVHLLLLLVSFLTDTNIFISMSAVGMIVPQSAWCLDFMCETLDIKFLGGTSYMYDDQLPIYLRFLSLFHGWLPFLLVYLIKLLGYDPRALYYQVCLCLCLCLLSYNQSELYNENINFVKDFHILCHTLGFPIIIASTHKFLLRWDCNKKYI
jgi:hypothetical protein